MNRQEDQNTWTYSPEPREDSKVDAEQSTTILETGLITRKSSIKRNSSHGDVRRRVHFGKKPEMIPEGATKISKAQPTCVPPIPTDDISVSSAGDDSIISVESQEEPKRSLNRRPQVQERRRASLSPAGRPSGSPSAGRRPRNPARSRQSFRSHSPRDDSRPLLRGKRSSFLSPGSNHSAPDSYRTTSSLSPKYGQQPVNPSPFMSPSSTHSADGYRTTSSLSPKYGQMSTSSTHSADSYRTSTSLSPKYGQGSGMRVRQRASNPELADIHYHADGEQESLAEKRRNLDSAVGRTKTRRIRGSRTSSTNNKDAIKVKSRSTSPISPFRGSHARNRSPKDIRSDEESLLQLARVNLD